MIAMARDRQHLSDDAGPVQNPRLAFIRWQCRARQIAVRNRGGKPDDSIMPQLLFGDLKRPSHGIITIMCRSPEFSVLPELAQLAKSTHDPAIRRENAERFFFGGILSNRRGIFWLASRVVPAGIVACRGLDKQR